MKNNVGMFRSQEFGGKKDMMFCGIFDGHGPWGHYVAKNVCESMPSALLCNWQEMLVKASVDPNCDLKSNKKLDKLQLWKNAFIKTCATVDQDLQHCGKFDSFHSGTTALAVIKQVNIRSHVRTIVFLQKNHVFWILNFI